MNFGEYLGMLFGRGEGEEIHVLASAREGWVAFRNYILSIPIGEEPVIKYMLGTWTVFVFLVLLLRKSKIAMFVLLCLFCMLAFFAPVLNGLLIVHWDILFTRPYFNKQGTFLAVFYSGPLVVLCLLCLVFFLRGVLREMAKLAAEKQRIMAIIDKKNKEAAEEQKAAKPKDD